MDIDGTICVGNRLIPGADRFLNGLSEYGGDYVFITNNTTMSVADYRKKFAKLGIPTTSGNFLTASVATAHYLKQKYGSRPVYVLGTDSLIRELESFGVCTTCDPEKEGIACVLASYDNELTYQKLTDICRLLTERPELDYAATNPDYVCPIEFGYVPDCGSICEMIGHCVRKHSGHFCSPCAFGRIYTRRNAELAVSCGVCLSIREGNVCGLGVWTKKEMLLKFRNGYDFGTKKQKEEF